MPQSLMPYYLDVPGPGQDVQNGRRKAVCLSTTDLLLIPGAACESLCLTREASFCSTLQGAELSPKPKRGVTFELGCGKETGGAQWSDAGSTACPSESRQAARTISGFLEASASSDFLVDTIADRVAEAVCEKILRRLSSENLPEAGRAPTPVLQAAGAERHPSRNGDDQHGRAPRQDSQCPKPRVRWSIIPGEEEFVRRVTEGAGEPSVPDQVRPGAPTELPATLETNGSFVSRDGSHDSPVSSKSMITVVPTAKAGCEQSTPRGHRSAKCVARCWGAGMRNACMVRGIPKFTLSTQELMDVRVAQLVSEVYSDSDEEGAVSLKSQLEAEKIESDGSKPAPCMNPSSACMGLRRNYNSENSVQAAPASPQARWKSVLSRFMIRFCALLPWEFQSEYGQQAAQSRISAASMAYAMVALGLVSTASLVSALDLLHSLVLPRSCPRLSQAVASDLLLGGCASFGLIGLGIGRARSNAMRVEGLLGSYLWQAGKFEHWEGTSARGCVRCMGLWCVVVATRFAGFQAACATVDAEAASAGNSSGRMADGPDACSWWSVARLVSFTLTSCVVVFIAHFLMRLSCSLRIMIDNFCFQATAKQDTVAAMHDWNVLQAAMRRFSSTTSAVFFVLMVTCACMTPALLRDVYDIQSWAGVARILPGALVTVLLVRALASAASLSDKAACVPSLINASWDSDRRRERLIQFLIHSSAGFNLWDTRVALVHIVRGTYLSGILAASLASNGWMDVARPQ